MGRFLMRRMLGFSEPDTGRDVIGRGGYDSVMWNISGMS
jgi:hypothetical protein